MPQRLTVVTANVVVRVDSGVFLMVARVELVLLKLYDTELMDLRLDFEERA